MFRFQISWKFQKSLPVLKEQKAVDGGGGEGVMQVIVAAQSRWSEGQAGWQRQQNQKDFLEILNRFCKVSEKISLMDKASDQRGKQAMPGICQ